MHLSPALCITDTNADGDAHTNPVSRSRSCIIPLALSLPSDSRSISGSLERERGRERGREGERERGREGGRERGTLSSPDALHAASAAESRIDKDHNMAGN